MHKTATILLASLLLCVPALAADKETKIQVRVDPELGKLNDEYEAAKKLLKPEQAALLDKIDTEQVQSSEPELALLGQAQIFAACEKVDPGLKQTHGKMMQSFKLAKIDEMIASRDAFMLKKNSIDFIEQKLLTAHLNMSRSMQMQMFKGMGGLIAQEVLKQGPAGEICTKLKTELVEFKKPYAPPTTIETVGAVSRDIPTGRLQACTLRFAYQDPKGFISTALVFLQEDPGKEPIFDFSTKIFETEAKALPVAETWLDLGSVNTRYTARMTKPGQQLMLGTIPETHLIIPVLTYLRDNPAIVAARAEGWDKPVAFEAKMADPANLNEVAACVASMKPQYAVPLRDAGFNLIIDSKHEAGKAAGAAQDPNYKMTQMMDNPENPGGCVWQFAPKMEGNREIGGALITTGHLMDDATRNFSTTFWVMAQEKTPEGAVRLNISDAWFATRDPQTGKPVDTRSFKPEIVKGQRYEINMPFASYIPFVSGIRKNGLRMNATANGQTFEKSYPPPSAASYRAYYNCVEALVKDRKKRAEKKG